MGAVTFSIDPTLVQVLTQATTFDCFVETGTYRGDTVERVRPFFSKIISIEYATSYYEAAASRFQEDPSVMIVHGDSGEVLGELAPQLREKAIVFWLDAHWCVDENTAGASSQCPLLRELAAIDTLHPDSVLLIDDARFFLTPPGTPHNYGQWPSFNDVWRGLRRLSGDHGLMAINDVIVYYPLPLHATLQAFAHEHGIDWLSVVDRSREHDLLLKEMKEKELVIEDVHAAAQERLREMQRLEAEVRGHEETLQEKEQSLAAMAEKVKRLEQMVAEKEQALAEQDEVLKHRKEIIEAGTQKRREVEQSLSRLEAEAREKDLTLADQAAALQIREEELADRKRMLAALQEELTAVHRTLTARDATIKDQEQALATREKEIGGLRETIRDGEQDLHDQARALAMMERDVRAREAQITSLEKALREKEDAAADREAVLRDKDRELVDKEAVIQAQHTSLQEKEALIQELETFRRTSLKYLVVYHIRPFIRRVLSAPLRLLRQPRWTLAEALRPRLGNLNHHDPVPLSIPRRYRTLQCNLDTPPTISIVTPSYNHAAFLERTLQSVLDQAYPNLEYVVQDGGSTDETNRILDHFRPRLSHVASRKDRGQAHAVNLGFAHTTGEIMAWLNSDDLLLPGALAYIATYFARHPDVDVVYGHRILIDEEDREIGRWVLPPHDDEILKWADYVPQETLFWRRSIWEKVGGAVDESFQFALDWDLILRFQEAGARFVRLPRFLGAFRIYEAQKTLDWVDVGEQEMTLLRERANGRPVTWEEINNNIRSYLRRATYLHLLYRAKLIRY